jgi:hypothetical protein
MGERISDVCSIGYRYRMSDRLTRNGGIEEFLVISFESLEGQGGRRLRTIGCDERERDRGH